MITGVISLNSTVSQVKGNLVSEMEGNKVMLNIEQGKYYNLGSVGGEIWDLIETPISIQTIINQLLDIYDIDTETCNKEVCEFISQLVSHKLVNVIN